MKIQRPSLHLLAFAAIYLACVAYLALTGNFPVENVLGVLVVFGLGFTTVAWLFTRNLKPVEQPKPFNSKEWLALAGVLLVLAGVLAVGFKNEWLPPDSRLSQALTLAKKIAVFFILPYLVYAWRFGFRLRDFGFLSLRETFRRRDVVTFIGLGALVLTFTYFMSRQAEPFREGEFSAGLLAWGLPVAFIWLLFEVGLTEEFFFRALMQDRLSTALSSKTGGIVWSGLLFALAHVPGVWLRGASTLEGLPPGASLLDCVAYCIPVMGLAGIFLGVVWARTRNFWLVAGIHALVDLLSNFKNIIFPG